MITTVEMYKTNDGKTFDSVSKAEEYVLNHAAEIFANRLNLQELNLTASEQYKIVDALTKDINALTKLYNELQFWMDEQ
jgi:hypothetical protein